ncbi:MULTISPECIES: DUF5005 domain-containing protein [Niastella]|uniref:DUF5005 domain-containing protein n=1 Tax=Niastella soli TaxID=2821487 RepID=A0ABS3YZ97_9BACT|nr:DUF5005 domain-containing protein [Niastella soli]MBO9202466.1 DUF5005 domain-containing protein [Niastella soli]
MRSKRLLAVCLLLLICGSQAVANFSQAHWRWRKDNGTENKATWISPQDFPATIAFVAGSPVRLRIEVYNSLTNTETGTVNLQYQRGSAGAWTTINTTTAGHDFVMAGSSAYVADKQATTLQIRDDGAGTFTGGKVLVNTWQFTDTINAGTKKEYEWCIKPTTSLSKDSIYQFRLLFTGSQDAFNYGSPAPNMMLRANTTIPGNAGIYKDPQVTAFFDRKTGWIASDGALTIPLSDGRVLWAMNDSYIDHLDTVAGTTPCLFQVRNAALVQPLGNWNWTATSTRIGTSSGIPSLFKNNTDDNYLLWPTGGYQNGDTVYVYNSNIKNSNEGLGFTRGGNDFLGKMIMPSLAVTGFDALQNFNDITFGIGFDTNEPDSYIYTWGVQGAFITSNIVVARFPRNNPRAPWSFWNGSAWDTAISHIAPVTTGASNGVYVAKVRNKYVALSTEFSVSCDAGTRIYVATSNSITGPFTNRKVLYTIPDNELGHTPFFYAPALHPEYINANNEILITYDINTFSNCVPACINNGFNPDYYRPRGLRVPLSLIDSSISLSGARTVVIPVHGGRVTVYPNPTHSCITVSLKDFKGRAANLVLRTTEGQAVYRNKVAVSGASANLTVNLPIGLKPGTYVLQVQNEEYSQVTKVMLQ